MLTAILSCALLSPVAPQAEPEVRVLGYDQDDFGLAAVVTRDRPWPVPIPTVTRSEVVQRVASGPEGLLLRVEGQLAPERIRVEAVVHAPDERILIVSGEPRLLGPARLPRSAVFASAGARHDRLPALARQDGIEAEGTIEYASAEGGLPLFGIGPADARLALRVEPQARGTFRAETTLDQLFHAEDAPCPAPAPVAFSTLSDGEGLNLLLETAELAQPGVALTLLVYVSLEGADTTPRPREAATAPAGFLRDAAHALLGGAWSHLEGADEQLDIRPTMGPGLAWGDVDADGRQDLYLVQGGGRAGSEVSTNRVLRNAESGFVDVTAAVGGADRGAGMGALFLDGDGDGDLDLYVANYGADVLFANEPGDELPRLADVSAAAGVGGDLWSAGVAATDFDLDGDLDLYVTSYLEYDVSKMPPPQEVAYRREDPIEMLPFAFPGQRNVFLRNESGPDGMRFVDATEELGLEDVQGRGMQAVFLDFDRDGDDDLYVANDVSYNVMYRNEGDGTFKDVSFSTGLDDPRGGMGLAVGDVEGDGDEDVFLTNWQLEPNALYLNNLLSHKSQRHHVATFRDAIVPSGLGPAGVGATSWGAEFFDAENDGDLDLFVANGYTSPDYESTGICVGQPNHFFENDGRGKFTDASAKAGAAVARELPSRAAVACDFDLDGDVDLAVTANNGPLQLLRNERPADEKGHWLLLRLRGAGGNTHGVGAEVTLKSGGRLFRRQLRAGTSYLGGNPPELHFGLGNATEIESLSVRWPGGAVTEHALDGVDRVVTLREE